MTARHTWRWILTPVACLIAWQVALVVGVAIQSTVESMCPQRFEVSGHHCAAPWMTPVNKAIIASSAGAAAALIMLAAVLTAPARKRLVATTTFGIGSLVAVGMGVTLNARVPMTCALMD
jgi:uncharacterized membrane protein